MKKLFNKTPECPFPLDASGKGVMAPAVPMTHAWWQGTGLMIVDPKTGRRSYSVACRFRGGQGDCQGRKEEC